MNSMFRNVGAWVIIALVLMMVFNAVGKGQGQSQEISFSQFLNDVRDKTVASVKLKTHTLEGVKTGGASFNTVIPQSYERSELITYLHNNGVTFSSDEPERPSLLTQILVSWFPILLLVGLFFFFARQMQGGKGGGGAFSFGKSKAKLLGEDQIKVTFDDVAGVDEAKEEVAELVDFLRDPSKFQRLGGRIPSGVLMVGPPGTGKTLIAKAIAGEAKVPFFSISGSDFVEMFVGVGASRVRDMFEQAKKSAPCIIFIDEIDAVGRKRGSGFNGGGHDEREQTLNQLLVEMDGFSGGEGIIVIAATNRDDVLDPALLRPGRFDRKVNVSLPTVKGREEILKVHLRKVPVDKNVDPNVVARGTPGFSGAELENLVNEAALFAARSNKKLVDKEDFEEARDKIMMGAEHRSLAMTEDEKELTAWHEAGHAIVGWLMPEHDPIHKVTIIPRGRALGVTHFLPEGDRISESKRKMIGKIATLYGGRAAEEMLRGPEGITSGASSDIQHATMISRAMVTDWGLSDLGLMHYADHQEGVYKQYSDESARAIDSEVRKITDQGYTTAHELLTTHKGKLETMADALLKYETIDSEQVRQIMEGEPLSPPDGWSDGGSNDGDSGIGSGIPKDKPSGSPSIGGPIGQN